MTAAALSSETQNREHSLLTTSCEICVMSIKSCLLMTSRNVFINSLLRFSVNSSMHPLYFIASSFNKELIHRYKGIKKVLNSDTKDIIFSVFVVLNFAVYNQKPYHTYSLWQKIWSQLFL